MGSVKPISVGIKSFFIEIGELAYFAGRFFKESLRPPFEFKENSKASMYYLHDCC